MVWHPYVICPKVVVATFAKNGPIAKRKVTRFSHIWLFGEKRSSKMKL